MDHYKGKGKGKGMAMDYGMGKAEYDLVFGLTQSKDCGNGRGKIARWWCMVRR